MNYQKKKPVFALEEMVKILIWPKILETLTPLQD
ncbi:hypothetical protein BGLY_0821 [Bacillus glycinifermentans]|nr:hypothetical protein BGLY_0821 [Bacillus glycinifermentans]